MTENKIISIDFCFNKIVEDTSQTLLKFISKLVSKGTITKKSLISPQCIQQNIGADHESRRNQICIIIYFAI